MINDISSILIYKNCRVQRFSVKDFEGRAVEIIKIKKKSGCVSLSNQLKAENFNQNSSDAVIIMGETNVSTKYQGIIC